MTITVGHCVDTMRAVSKEPKTLEEVAFHLTTGTLWRFMRALGAEVDRRKATQMKGEDPNG